MLTAERQKRKWIPFYLFDPLPVCPRHGIPCVVRNSYVLADGRTMQRRKCPVCAHTVKAIYRPPVDLDAAPEP